MSSSRSPRLSAPTLQLADADAVLDWTQSPHYASFKILEGTDDPECIFAGGNFLIYEFLEELDGFPKSLGSFV